MIDPDTTIYGKLVELVSDYPGLVVYAERPEIIESFPAITYIVSNNVPIYDLNKTVGEQDITVNIDVWADTSSESGELVLALEAKMKELDYYISSNINLVDPNGGSHRALQFIF